ncbi:hypothetical protein KHP62_06945 [Rhodobacteraceae bacterium NNCM2]|nr:hypothetical protein [Coraliihabitans acroporae]
MYKTIFTGLVGAALLSGCSETLPSGVERYDRLAQEGTLVGDWVDCTGASCEAQLRALDGGYRANAIVFMPAGCYHTGTEIVSEVGGKVFAPRPAYVDPVTIELDRDDLTALSLGGTMLVTFAGCRAGEGESGDQAAEITFPADQVQEINNRLTDRPPSGLPLPLRL